MIGQANVISSCDLNILQMNLQSQILISKIDWRVLRLLAAYGGTPAAPLVSRSARRASQMPRQLARAEARGVTVYNFYLDEEPRLVLPDP